MNRKGFFQGVPDIVFFLLLVLVLVAAWALLGTQNQRIEAGAAGDGIDWEAGWLANAMMAQPWETFEGQSLLELSDEEITGLQATNLEYEIRDNFLSRYGKTYDGDAISRDDTIISSQQNIRFLLIQNEEVLIQHTAGYGSDFIDRGLFGNLGAETMTYANQTAFLNEQESGQKGIAKAAGENPITLIVGVTN